MFGCCISALLLWNVRGERCRLLCRHLHYSRFCLQQDILDTARLNMSDSLWIHNSFRMKDMFVYPPIVVLCICVSVPAHTTEWGALREWGHFGHLSHFQRDVWEFGVFFFFFFRVLDGHRLTLAIKCEWLWLPDRGKDAFYQCASSLRYEQCTHQKTHTNWICPMASTCTWFLFIHTQSETLAGTFHPTQSIESDGGMRGRHHGGVICFHSFCRLRPLRRCLPADNNGVGEHWRVKPRESEAGSESCKHFD